MVTAAHLHHVSLAFVTQAPLLLSSTDKNIALHNDATTQQRESVSLAFQIVYLTLSINCEVAINAKELHLQGHLVPCIQK